MAKTPLASPSWHAEHFARRSGPLDRNNPRFAPERTYTVLDRDAITGLMAMMFPTFCMGVRQLLHKGWQITIFFRPEHKMPVVGHQAICTNAHRPDMQCFREDFFKRPSSRCLFQTAFFDHASIENVEDHSAGSIPIGS